MGELCGRNPDGDQPQEHCGPGEEAGATAMAGLQLGPLTVSPTGPCSPGGGGKPQGSTVTGHPVQPWACGLCMTLAVSHQSWLSGSLCKAGVISQSPPSHSYSLFVKDSSCLGPRVFITWVREARLSFMRLWPHLASLCSKLHRPTSARGLVVWEGAGERPRLGWVVWALAGMDWVGSG